MKAAIFFALSFVLTAAGVACDGTWQVGNGNWGTPANWGNVTCYPGDSGNTDTATFGPVPSSPVTVNLDVSPALPNLVFNKNYYAGPFYTIAGGNTITINGTSPQISVVAGVHEILAQMNIQNPLNITVSDPNGNLIFGANFFSNASIAFAGPGTLTHRDNGSFGVNGTLTIGSGNFINQRTDLLNSGTAVQCQNIILSDGAALVNNNSVDNTFNSLVVVMAAQTDFTMNRGTVTNTNSGKIDGGGTGNGGGAGLFAISSMSINGTTISQLNSGAIIQVGVIGAALFSQDTLTISGAAITSQNLGSVTGDQSLGVAIMGQNSCVVSDSAISLINQGNVTGTGNFGAILMTNDLTMSGGSFLCTNSGTIDLSDNKHAIGSLIIGQNTFTMNGGTIAIDNSGTILNGAFGSALAAPQGAFNMNGGLITINNSGTLIGAKSFGSGIGADNLNLNSGTIVNNDHLIVTQATIGHAGVLRGNGFIDDLNQTSSTQVDNQGTIMPGDPTGTIVVQGGYTQEANGSLVVKYRKSSPNNWGKLVVTGQVNLSGKLILHGLSGATYRTGTIVVVDNSGFSNPISGKFSEFITKNLPRGVKAKLIYTPNQVLIHFDVTICRRN